MHTNDVSKNNSRDDGKNDDDSWSTARIFAQNFRVHASPQQENWKHGFLALASDG